jgi:hypothetical protein
MSLMSLMSYMNIHFHISDMFSFYKTLKHLMKVQN